MSEETVTAPVTPGQAAYEVYRGAVADVLLPPWEELTSAEHRAWYLVGTIEARKPGSERVAEFVTEVNDLRWERDRYKAALERIAHRGGGDSLATIAADALSSDQEIVR